jgi:probable HAF family extracellular repeat protein
MHRFHRFFAPCAGAVLALPLLAVAAPLYNVTVVAGAGSTAYDLNMQGDVVGDMQSGGAARAYLFSDGILTDLGTLGGASSYASSINDHGQVVGSAQLADGTSRGYLYSNGTMAALPSTSYTAAAAINNAGTIAGSMAVDDPWANPQHAFTYGNGAYADLGTFRHQRGAPDRRHRMQGRAVLRGAARPRAGGAGTVHVHAARRRPGVAGLAPPPRPARYATCSSLSRLTSASLSNTFACRSGRARGWRGCRP